jgi:lysozyme
LREGRAVSGRISPTKLRLSQQGTDLLAEREGEEFTAYLDSTGVLTIGIGHTSGAGPPKVTQGMTITQDQSRKIFRADASRFRKEAAHLVKVPCYTYEWDALCSFLFNIGTTQFAGSTPLKRLNQGDYPGCAESLLWWDQPPEIMSRRQAEHDQFLAIQFVARAT